MSIPTAAEVLRRREERENYTSPHKDIKKVMANRSKGPYHLEHVFYDPNNIFVQAGDGPRLFRFGCRDNWDEIDEGNVTFILNAMNSFDALVELAEQYKASTKSPKKLKEINKVLKMARSRVEIHHS